MATRNVANAQPKAASRGGDSRGGSFAYGKGKTATAPVTPPTPQPQAPAQDYSGGYDGGYGRNTALPYAAGPVDTGMSEQDWLAGDSAYAAQLAALQRALADTTADFTAQKSKYDVDYNDSLRTLGWRQEAEGNPGSWNLDDLTTASGRAFQNQQNDFASRGVLQSSLYGTANDNLMRSLNDQLTSVNTGRTNFLDDMTRQESTFKNENTLNQQQARAEALARRAAGITL